MEESLGCLIPLKSSLSIIIGSAQVSYTPMKVSADEASDRLEDTNRLGVLMQRLVKTKNQKREITKQARHIFTCSQPPVAVDKQVEVYETASNDVGLSGFEPHILKDQPRCAKHIQALPSPACLVKDDAPAQEADGNVLSTLSEMVWPKQICSEVSCSLTPTKSNLLYTVSNDSLPILSRSQNRLLPPKTLPASNVSPGCRMRSPYIHPRRAFKKPLGKDVFIDGPFPCKIAKTIQIVTNRIQRKKFMSYAKFNSSYKLSEVHLEDINRSLSRIPHLVRSIQLSRLIHEINPDFDDNQSISEAMTALKSVSSASFCQIRVRPHTLTGNLSEWRQNELSSSRPIKAVVPDCTSGWPQHLSNDETSLKSSVRKVHLMGVGSSWRFTCIGEVGPVSQRLVDYASPWWSSGVSHKAAPVWQLKSNKPVVNSSADLMYNFASKANDFFRARYKTRSYRCFFGVQPTYRLVDECVQFPDVALPWDRSPNVKQSLNENYEPAHHPDNVPQEWTVLPSLVCPENHSQATNLDVTCDQPPNSSSDLQTVSTDANPNAAKYEEGSSVKPPDSTLINNQVFSSERPAVPKALSSQHQKRKIKSKLEPIFEEPMPKQCKRNVPEQNHFRRSYRAICDKKKIKIRYNNGKYTVLKEKNKPIRQTVWSILTGKASHLFHSVIDRKRAHRSHFSSSKVI